jgi:glycosyltransferase involved in cell wall biosynthesis
MMKIVQISVSPMGGAGIAAYRLHKSLLNNGINSLFICQDAGSYKNDADVIEVKPRGFSLIHRVVRKLRQIIGGSNFSAELEKHPGHYEIATWPETNYLVELEKAILDADIIHLHWVSGFVNYLTFFKKLKHKKIVWTLHDMNPFMGIFHYKGDQLRNPGLKKIDQKAIEIKSAAFKNIDLQIVVLSNWMLEEAITNPVFKGFNYTNIPNGVDCNIFKPVDRKLAREKLNIPEEDCVILVVSERVDNYRKGIDILLEALSSVQSKIPVRIISVGKGELNLSGTNTNYTALGPIYNEKELANVYTASNLFVIPSREDNLPNVMLEAFACGIPVLGFPIGGVKQYVIPFQTGLLAEDISATALNNALEQFLLNRDRFSSLLISEYAQNKFNNNLLADNHLRFYKSLLNG